MSRRLVIDWVLCTTILMAAYAGRGWLLAWLLAGRYPLASLLFDVTLLGLLICLFRSLDLGLRLWFAKLLRRRFPAAKEDAPPWRWRILGDVLRFGMVFAVAAPFLVTFSQLHPQ